MMAKDLLGMYVVSVFLIAMHWELYAAFTTRIEHVSILFLVLNMAFLFFVSLIVYALQASTLSQSAFGPELFGLIVFFQSAFKYGACCYAMFYRGGVHMKPGECTAEARFRMMASAVIVVALSALVFGLSFELNRNSSFFYFLFAFVGVAVDALWRCRRDSHYPRDGRSRDGDEGDYDGAGGTGRGEEGVGGTRERDVHHDARASLGVANGGAKAGAAPDRGGSGGDHGEKEDVIHDCCVGMCVKLQGKRQGQEVAASRVETLSDGVFAIALTLIMLDLTVPSNPPRSWHEFANVEIGGLADVLSYGATFLVISSIWLLHNRITVTQHRYSTGGLGFNTLCLSTTALGKF